MAQTGYTPILIYSSSTAAAAPSASNLTNSTLGSELAINITDGKLFYKDNANAIQVIAWKTTPTSAGGTGLTSYIAGDLLYYATGTTLSKLAIGTAYQALQVNAGATAPSWQPSATSVLTTQGDLLYASAANVLARLAKNTSATRYLSNTGSSNNPAWAQIDLTNGVTGILPTANGGTGSSTVPVFRAYRNGTQTISSTTFTKVALNAENFDTASAFDSTTNYRFQPTQAGYYQFNGAVNIAPSVAPTRLLSFIYKNGAAYAQGQDFNSIPGSGGTSTVSTIIYLNGSTDYVELWTFIIAATAAIGGGDVYTYLDGVYVRAT